MKKRQIALRVVPAIVALAAVLWWISGAELAATIRECRIGPLLAGAALQIAALIVLGLRWRAGLHALRAEPLPSVRAATVLSLRAQAAVVLAPGGLGTDVMRGYESGYGREMWSTLAKVAVLERVVGAIVLALLCGMTALPLLGWSWSLIMSGALIAAAIVFARASGSMPHSRRIVIPVLSWTIVAQLLALAALTAAIVATGIDLSLWLVVAVAAIASFAAMLPVSIHGYGIRELALAALAPRLNVPAKSLAAAGLVASTALVACVLAASLAARLIPVGEGAQEDAR